MHTNFAQTHLNRYVFERVLGLPPEREEPFLLEARVDWSLEELRSRLTEAFGPERFRVVAPRERIGSVALCTGAGASLMDRVEAECFLTGDIKYHDAMKAMSQGLMMVDIGHWESERFFAELMAEQLKNLPISAIIAPSKNPFTLL
jgi:putative NIF3 family GTP cyclohydrolase 1 type 2